MATEQTPQSTEKPATENAVVAKKDKSATPELSSATINRLPESLKALKGCFAMPFDAFRKAYKDPGEADRKLAKEIDFAVQAMTANPYLVKCATDNPMALVNALKNVALTNSTLNPVLKQGYLVPFKGAIQFMPSYMGLVDVLVNNGLVRKIEAHAVFEGDEFEIRHGTGGGIFHKPNPWGKRDKDALKGCYYYAVLTDGTEMFDTMSKEEIDVIRRRSPSASSKSSTPWDTDYTEMAKKCLVRRAFKMIAKSGISEDKLKAVEAVSDYDEKVERSWIASLKSNSSTAASDFDEDVTEYEEIKE